MPAALLKQSKVRLRRRFLASAKLEQVRLCPYRKRSPILNAPSPRPLFARNRFCCGMGWRMCILRLFEPRSSPPPHRGGLLKHSCRRRRTAHPKPKMQSVRTARAAAFAPRRPATHFTFESVLRRLPPENSMLIYVRQPAPPPSRSDFGRKAVAVTRPRRRVVSR